MSENDENLQYLIDRLRGTAKLHEIGQATVADYSLLWQASNELARLSAENRDQAGHIDTLKAENATLRAHLNEWKVWQRTVVNSDSTRQEEIDDDWEGLEID